VRVQQGYGRLQAAVPLDKESGLALLTGQLLLSMLEMALPVKVLALQQLQAQGRSLRAHQREEPDDLQLARQELEGLLQQIQPEPYKFYERWEVLLSTERGSRRTASLIRDLWRHLPEQLRLRPEGAGDLRRFRGLLQEARGLCIKLQQDRHHASHSKADTAFHSLSWHVMGPATPMSPRSVVIWAGWRPTVSVAPCPPRHRSSWPRWPRVPRAPSMAACRPWAMGRCSCG